MLEDAAAEFHLSQEHQSPHQSYQYPTAAKKAAGKPKKYKMCIIINW